MISKEFFIECMDAIKKDIEYREIFYDTLNKILDDGGGGLKNINAENKLVEWLQKTFNDENAHSVIEYFIYELDFGIRNEQLGLYEDNIKVPLSNAGELYEYLISNIKNQ